MSTAPATAASQQERPNARLRNVFIGTLFALVLLIPKLLRVRHNAQSWLALRIFLGLAGAALVVLPLSLWNSWLAAPAGLIMFLAAILLPGAVSHLNPDEKARELGALIVINGGKYQSGNTASTPVQLFVGAEQIWALDAHFHPSLVIPVEQIASANVSQRKNRWLLQVRWAENVSEFSYQGVFAEHLARVAESTLAGVMRSPLPILAKTRAAGA